MRSLWKNSIWIIFMIIVLILLPSSISAHAQTEDRSIIVAIGFDRLANGNVELSAEVIVPRYETTYNQNAQIISSEGVNSTEALASLSVQTGKVIGLSHCSAFVFGNSMKDENIIEFIDQILRGKRVNYNAQLIFTESKARDVLVKAIEIDKNYNQNINTIVQFNDEFVNVKTLLLSDFYKTYYDGYGASFMPVINLIEKEYGGLSQTMQLSQKQNIGNGGGEGGQNGEKSNSTNFSGGNSGKTNNTSSQSNNTNISQSSKQQYLSNGGKTAVFSNGRIVNILNKDEILGFGLLTNESKRGAIVINNVNDGILMNAELSFSVKNRSCTKTFGWSENGKPRIYYSFNYFVKLEQVKNENDSNQIVDETKVYLSPKVKQIFCDKIRQECGSAILKGKELNLDLLNIYQSFNRFQHKKWQKYMQSLSEKNDYVQDIEFFIDVNVYDMN